MTIELPAVSGEAKVTKKVNKAAETFEKYFSKGEENRSGSTSELATWMDSVLLKEVILVLLLPFCLDTICIWKAYSLLILFQLLV